MQLKDLLAEKKKAILEKWFDLILKSYPGDTQRFWRRDKDRFSNPVRYLISEGIEGIFEVLLEGKEEEISSFLDKIIRVRAVQDFSPSKALVFIFQLKKAIREELGDKALGVAEELKRFEERIDGSALLSFDIYMQCRERVYEIRVNEIKRMTFGLLRKANLIYEIPDFKEDNMEKGESK
jgi:hypothetical protein